MKFIKGIKYTVCFQRSMIEVSIQILLPCPPACMFCFTCPGFLSYCSFSSTCVRLDRCPVSPFTFSRSGSPTFACPLGTVVSSSACSLFRCHHCYNPLPLALHYLSSDWEGAGIKHSTLKGHYLLVEPETTNRISQF